MKEKLLHFYDVTLCTAFGAGFWPWGPGTMGALMGVFLWWLASLVLPQFMLMILTAIACVVVTLLSIPSINRMEKEWGPDPSRVVIDEVVGMWISLVPVLAHRESWSQPYFTPWYWILAAFVLFRFFDIVKPTPIHQMEKFPGGVGVMMDDIMAGLFSAFILCVAELFFLYFMI